MEIKSLARLTDLMFAKFSGTVEDKGSYTVIQTPSNPGYHWGNYLVFENAPKLGDLQKWKKTFLDEFPYYSEPSHFVFTWESEEKGEIEEFLQEGFEFDTAVVLATGRLNEPPHYNRQIQVRPLSSDEDWEKSIQLQVLCADSKYLNPGYEGFKRNQMGQYRKMAEAQKGHWFGAFLGDQIVGDLGIFYEGKVARYQSVGTHPDFRRQGFCGTLVFESGQFALKNWNVETLVMEADVDYHAARIYQSVGFQKSEINHALSWWKGK